MKKYFTVCLCVLTAISTMGQEKKVFTQDVGAYKVSVLAEAQNSGSTSILIGATPEMIRETVPDGSYASAVNAFLIQHQGNNILVDAGFGKELFNNLKLLGVDASQINAVLLTHMHGDHIGGLLTGGLPSFPNADVYLSRQEHDYWMNKGQAPQVSVIDAYKNRLHLFSPLEAGEQEVLLDGVKAIAAFGHTPGHTMYFIESGNESMIIWGDLAHAMAIQMPYPQVALTYDVNPEQAIATRLKALEYIEKNNITVAGMHIAWPSIGRISKADKTGYIFTPAEY